MDKINDNDKIMIGKTEKRENAGWPKKPAHFVLYASTSSNIDRFSITVRIKEHL